MLGGGGVPQPVFIDTGAWFALHNHLDVDHQSAREAVAGLRRQPVTTEYVFDEAVTLALSRANHELAVQVGSTLLDPSSVRLVSLREVDRQAAWRLFQDRPDKAYSFTDCTSFVVMRRLGIEHVIATDGDFEQEGFTNLLGSAEA